MERFTRGVVISLEDERLERLAYYQKKAAAIVGDAEADNDECQAVDLLLALYQAKDPQAVADGVRALLMNRAQQSRILQRMSGADMIYIALVYAKFQRRYQRNKESADKNARENCLLVLSHYLHSRKPIPEAPGDT
jgi:hypothetical protein